MEALCRELSAKPQHIARTVDELRTLGFHIDLSPVDGYRYVVSAEPLWNELLLNLLKHPHRRRLARRVNLLPSTTSTNDLARLAASDPANDGLVIFTEFQTAGRGRQGASWVSPPAANLLFSVLLFDPQHHLKSHLLTLAAGLALAEAVQQITNLKPTLKWPNDLLIDNKKLAGILVERCSDSSDTPALIIGVGLNCNSLPNDLPPNATSLRQASSQIIDRHALAHAILTRLEAWIDSSLHDRRDDIRREYLQRSDLLGRTVQLRSQGHRYSGRIIDLDPFQGILVQLERGGVRLFTPATTSLLN